ncbi:hypothetical protein DFH11DRAFT_1689366 [Phellopilus nigrolimitatus]|nr:hypothetical protein DFH11DRAFT_1689366 [Phellopilus nigrolimitatus]
MSSAAPSMAKSTAAAASAAAATAPKPPDAMLAYYLDIALLCAVGFFFLVLLPRTIARFSSHSGWSKGLVLKGGRAQSPPTSQLHLQRQYTSATLAEDGSDQSHTLAAHNNYYGGSKEQLAKDAGRLDPPPHVPTLTSMLNPISSLLLYSVAPGKTIGKLSLMTLYLAAVVFVTFFMDGNPLANSKRLGMIAVSQVPVAIALGTKNNLVGMLVGMGYERLNFLHRWVGIVTFGAANLHALGYIYKWALAKELLQEIQTPLAYRGLIGLFGLQMLYFTSLGFIRQRAYGFFLASHIAGLALFLVGICYHEPFCIRYVSVGLIIYGFDHLLRIVKTRFASARVTAVKELGLTRVEIPTHVRLRVFSGEMGVFGWSIAHPFTVATASNGRGLVLMCKKAGSWTNKLYAAAATAGEYAAEDGFGAQRELRVVVEGPYGGLGNMVMASYSAALLVAGGSGITFALSAVEELVQDICNSKSAIKFIEISEGKESAAGQRLAAHLATLAPSLNVYAGRPPLARTMDSIAKLTSALPHARGVAVGVCGPLGLVQQVGVTARGVDGELRSACGGVEVHEEMFGW